MGVKRFKQLFNNIRGDLYMGHSVYPRNKKGHGNFIKKGTFSARLAIKKGTLSA